MQPTNCPISYAVLDYTYLSLLLFTDHPRLHIGAMRSRRWLVSRLETKPTRIYRAKAALALSIGGLWKLSKTLIVEHSDETATVFYPSRSTLQYTTLQRV